MPESGSTRIRNKGSASAIIYGALLSLSILTTVIGLAWLSGIIEERTVLGVVLALTALLMPAVMAIFMPQDSSPLARSGWARDVAYGIVAAIFSLLLLTFVLRSVFSSSGLWSDESLIKGITIMICLTIGGKVAQFTHKKVQ